MSWLRRSLERLTGAPPPVDVDPQQEEARRRLEAVRLHGTHAELGAELAPQVVECAALDVAAFVSARAYRSATTNVLVVPDLAEGAVLLAAFEGNYKAGATALACSLVASALCDATLAVAEPFDPARAETTLRDAFSRGAELLAALETAGAPDDIWTDFVREKVLDSRGGFRGLGTSVTAALVVGTEVTLAHVGETEAHRLGADGAWTRLTASHLLVDDPRYAEVEDRTALEGVVTRILMASSAELEITHATLEPGDTLVLATPSVARRLAARTLGTGALEGATQCLALAQAESIPAAAVVARLTASRAAAT